jgi:hypothetical protein
MTAQATWHRRRVAQGQPRELGGSHAGATISANEPYKACLAIAALHLRDALWLPVDERRR